MAQAGNFLAGLLLGFQGARERKKDREEKEKEDRARKSLFEIQMARERRAMEEADRLAQERRQAQKERHDFFGSVLDRMSGTQSQALPGTNVMLGNVDAPAGPQMGLADALAQPDIFIKSMQAGVPLPQAPQGSDYEQKMRYLLSNPAAVDLERQLRSSGATNINLGSQGLTQPPQGMFRPDPAKPGVLPEPGSVTVGQESLDKQFGQDAAAWVAAGGFADAQKSITQLDEAKKALEAVAEGKSKERLTGPMISKIPEFSKPLFNPAAVRTRDAVEEVVQRNLRLVLGPQFTEKEGERLIARAYNENLDEAENAKRVGRIMKQLKSAAQAKQEAVNYFSEHGTLAGFKGKIWTLADFDPETGDDSSGNRPARPGTKVIDFSELPP